MARRRPLVTHLVIGRSRPGSLLGHDRGDFNGPFLVDMAVAWRHRHTGLVDVANVGVVDWESGRLEIAGEQRPLRLPTRHPIPARVEATHRMARTGHFAAIHVMYRPVRSFLCVGTPLEEMDMTTEAALAPAGTAGGARPEVCGCGQDLDCCDRAHCPRCGCEIHRAA